MEEQKYPVLYTLLFFVLMRKRFCKLFSFPKILRPVNPYRLTCFKKEYFASAFLNDNEKQNKF